MKHSLVSLAFHLDRTGPSFFQQLIDQTKSALSAGRLRPGDRLPSSRHLAAILGVSRSTVSRAYDHLLAEGVVRSEPKRGLFASDLIPISTQRRPQQSRHNAKAEPLLRCDSGVDTEVFPAKIWAASTRRSWLRPDRGLLAGDYLTGYPPLKAAIADYLFRLRGLECTPEQIFVTSGNRDSLTLLQHVLDHNAPGAAWWLEDPTYPPIRALLSGRSDKLGFLKVDAEGACLPPSNNLPQVALLTPNRQYPLGVCQSHTRRQAWLRMLRDEALWLIEDDYDTEFAYHGRMGLPLMQADASARIFLLGSFSKVMFRGLRLGFVVAPLAQCDALYRVQRQLSASASLPIQPALADFMNNGQFERHLNRMRRHYLLKRDHLLSLLSEHLSDAFEWTSPSGGMHIKLSFKTEWLAQRPSGVSDLFIARTLAQQGVEVETLSAHYASFESDQQGFVLGFSSPSFEIMEKVVRTLSDCIQTRNAWLTSDQTAHE